MALKPQDIVVLLKIAGLREAWTIQQLADGLDLSPSAVHRSLGRLQDAGLVDRRRRINSAQAIEFLEHAVRYLVPPKFEGEARGIPTAHAAAPLVDQLAPSNGPPPVWPHPRGDTRGIALLPIHESAPEAALRDKGLGERLALVDALRTGDARLRGLAARALGKSLMARPG
jgi:DNA-binding transcriptional ArsR family regulator